jgi:hypothetical protein
MSSAALLQLETSSANYLNSGAEVLPAPGRQEDCQRIEQNCLTMCSASTRDHEDCMQSCYRMLDAYERCSQIGGYENN